MLSAPTTLTKEEELHFLKQMFRNASHLLFIYSVGKAKNGDKKLQVEAMIKAIDSLTNQVNSELEYTTEL